MCSSLYISGVSAYFVMPDVSYGIRRALTPPQNSGTSVLFMPSYALSVYEFDVIFNISEISLPSSTGFAM